MKAISIKLPEQLLHSVVQRAMQKSVTQSDVIRAALTSYFSKDEAAPDSAAAQASRWAGLGKGATDLSTHPKHMKGFGQ
jgi:Arc/MetJ-type ribon-helix-helix transcriptional regulator